MWIESQISNENADLMGKPVTNKRNRYVTKHYHNKETCNEVQIQ